MNTIYYPARPSHFEVQTMIFSILKEKNYDVKGEVKAIKSRLDLVIFNDDRKAICIIEIKALKKIRLNRRKYKQTTKYENLFNLPVVICLNMSQVNQTIERVDEICQARK